MLRELGIKNFVLIEDLRLELDKGLNVLTGETGAGKSIVLDALGLLLGDRFAWESVRQGAERSELDAVFDVPKTAEFRRWWEDHGFQKSDDVLIRREGYPDGRSRAYLNDRPVTLGALQELGGFLVDIHGQNEHQHILKPSVQLESLDRFAGLESAAAAVAPLYKTWQSFETQREANQLSEQERMQRVDIFRFQRQEIDAAKVKIGQDAELAQQLPELKNAEKLRAQSATAYGALYQEEGSALERLGHVEHALEALKGLAPSTEPLFKELQVARASLDELARQLQNLGEKWESDPAALEANLARQDLLDRLKRKYGGSLEAVLAHAEKVRGELDRLENADHYRRELDAKSAQAQAELGKVSRALSTKRQRAAKDLGEAVQKELADLGLKQTVFRCVVEPLPVASSSGIDRVVFEWAPNPGEGIQPLKAIASGGEMSRVMLALKTVLAHADAVPTLVFDEIDAGIGGLTAQAVGRKLRTLSRHHQVLCVSHLPQIASCAHAHFQVTKRVARTRTLAEVVRLEPEERLNELARLLGSQITPTSVQHAKEMLAQNQ